MQIKAQTIIHDTFRISIFIKGFDAVLQVIGAVLVLVIQPSTVVRWIYTLTASELATDPKDWLANHLINFAQDYSIRGQIFGALYLFSHGVVKFFLIAALWQKRLWAYPAAMIIFSLFCVYQLYRYDITHSLGLIVLTILDIGVIILTWLEYRLIKSETLKL